nr:chemotaxis protein CheX [Bacillus dakarensis]
MTGDVKGKLILSGDSKVFGSIGEMMFGMKLEKDMLSSFSGELGNMIAGGISSRIFEEGLQTDITSPTVLSGNTTISGYGRALHIPASFEKMGEMGIFLLLDSLKGA